MLNDGNNRPCPNSDTFRQGMIVLHAEFGLGKSSRLAAAAMNERQRSILRPAQGEK